VGDPGNRPSVYAYGSVGVVYQIGKYEVTIQQYTDFLNAVASTDDHNLYNTDMVTDLNVAGIQQTSGPGGSTYSVISNQGYSGNRPVSYVDWYDAARFAN